MNKSALLAGAQSPHVHMTPNKRTLAVGFAYQQYAVKSIRFISRTEFKEKYHESRQEMEAGFEEWSGKCCKYILSRAESLGLHVDRVFCNLVEEPDEDKAIAVRLWIERDAAWVWACWSYLEGPVPSAVKQEGVLPAFGFFPADRMLQNVVAEDTGDIFNVNTLLGMETGKVGLVVP